MLHIDEYRDPDLCRAILREIETVSLDRVVTIMEVCGTHTQAVARNGIRHAMPPPIRLISGPGCPVCVTPNTFVDHACALARGPEITIATFGDMLRVPGSTSSLELEQAAGADIRVVFSPLETIRIATENPGCEVVFLGVGFETTAPTIAGLILTAARDGVANVSVLASTKVMPPPMRALASDPDVPVDGYLCPAHVSAIIGTRLYEEIARDCGIPCVVAGFEPVDVLRSIHLLAERISQGRPGVDNEYSRIVRPEGNTRALEVIDTVFEPVDAEWRGLGVIPESGLGIRSEYERFDAASRFDVEVEPAREHPGCRCGEVLRGILDPHDCALFGRSCTPNAPVGPCMVSSEGTCAAAHTYDRVGA